MATHTRLLDATQNTDDRSGTEPAVLISAPVAYLVARRSLENFAYRIKVEPVIFVITGAAVILIALTTVSYQAIKVAVANPVDALRNE